MANILVTGSNGFIGKRLVYQLLGKGHEIYALTRVKGTGLDLENNPHFHLIHADLKNPPSADLFPKNIDAAYYLVHSMATLVEDLAHEEEKIAHHFLQAVEKTCCKQIIFLSGIIEDEKNLSPHLRSRLAVENILKTSCIPVTILRSSIIIGSGSASFEMIRDLVEKLPLMIAPRWVHSICQPISIRDVLFYLEAILINEKTFHQTFDIAGPTPLSFKELLLRYAAFRHLKRWIIDVPCLTPRLSSYWLVLITSVRYSICSYLVESMKQNTRKLNCAIDQLIPYACLSFEEALQLAFQKIEQNEVASTWMDAWEFQTISNIQDLLKVPKEGCLKDIQIFPIQIPLEELKERIFSIGGDRGWYTMNWAWKVRGLIDQLIKGTGLNRGRRDPHQLHPGDSVDFWRVLLANQNQGHLILYAEMKLPGEAWLEFRIDQNKNLFYQTATFRPKGLWGRMYWYILFPIHWFIFRKMAQIIAQKLVNNF